MRAGVEESLNRRIVRVDYVSSQYFGNHRNCDGCRRVRPLFRSHEVRRRALPEVSVVYVRRETALRQVVTHLGFSSGCLSEKLPQLIMIRDHGTASLTDEISLIEAWVTQSDDAIWPAPTRRHVHDDVGAIRPWD